MRLIHLTAVGADVPPASVEFGRRLTVVYGASDSGKSYIIDAIDYLLGGRELRDLREAAGYDLLMLGLELNDETVVTLTRPLRGGRIGVYDDDVRIRPDRMPDLALRARHSKTSDATVSHYLLADLGIADAQVRKNLRNEVQTASFRNLAHLCLVREDRMIAGHSPVESGNNPTTRTAERSVFKLLLEGDDDSDLVEGEDPRLHKRISRAQLEVLQRAIDQIRQLLVDAPARPAVVEQLASVNRAVDQTSAAVGQIVADRDSLVHRRARLQHAAEALRQRIAEARSLLSRFALLDQQYASDLGRLTMVREAGSLLGYFDSEVCVFCGAAQEHQSVGHAVYETTRLAESVDTEIQKTTALKGDLAATLGGLATDQDESQFRLDEYINTLDQLAASIAELDARAVSAQEELSGLLIQRSELERYQTLLERIAELEQLRTDVETQEPVTADPVRTGIGPRARGDFSAVLRRLLVDWGVPGADDTTVNFEDAPEIVLDQRRRADRGKGVRAILHAGFAVALSEFCLERDRPHPGFVALDTPVLTYRDAETGVIGDVADELLNRSVATAFYDCLASNLLSQVVVIENQTPPEITSSGCRVVFFSGSPGQGRAGFYPVLAAEK